MAELADLDYDRRVATLVEDLPGFISFDICVGQVFDLMMGDPKAYVDAIDMDWLMLVYRIHHKEVIQWCDLPYADLIDEDYSQQAVNFVMASTINWVKKFCEAYADSGDKATLTEKVGNCEVFYLDRYKVRVH